MDPNTIDRLARLIGSGQSRRRVLKTLAGGAMGAVAAVIGMDAASAAARCRVTGVTCSKDADCCSSACGPRDRTGRQVCGCRPDPIDVTCGALCGPQTNNCGQSVDCGACCTPLDQCHLAGTYNADSEACTNPVAPNGTACTDDNALCVNGACCTTGHQVVHGGCFEIHQIDGPPCPDGCLGFGSIDGSDNYLCSHFTGGGCSTTADCPSGQACASHASCLAPC